MQAALNPRELSAAFLYFLSGLWLRSSLGDVWNASLLLVENIAPKRAIHNGHGLLALARLQMQLEELGPGLEMLRDRLPGSVGLDPGTAPAWQPTPDRLTSQTVDF